MRLTLYVVQLMVGLCFAKALETVKLKEILSFENNVYQY